MHPGFFGGKPLDKIVRLFKAKYHHICSIDLVGDKEGARLRETRIISGGIRQR